MAGKKRLFTGMQPSGALHIGNYFGALKPTIDLFEEYEGLVMVADYHALNSLRRPDQLKTNIFSVTGDYLAAGLDPSKAIIFKQSDVPEHTELTWIFDCLVTVPFLMQSHAYKDKVAKGLEANAGLFTYPMLMAADILLYDTDIVPVGEDQRQHVEYAREAAAKFNTTFGPTFKEPEEKIKKEIAVIPGTDGKKMSKSYGNTIPLFGSESDTLAAVMNIKTDSTPVGKPLNPETDLVFVLHRLFNKDLPGLEKRYKEGSIGYKESKELLAQEINQYLHPMRERRASITESEIKSVLRAGAEKARAMASAKMKVVREKIGVSL